MSSHPRSDPESPPGEVASIRLPHVPDVFEGRAARLRQLAPGHALEGYLLLLAHVTDAQAGATPAASEIDAMRRIAAHLRGSAARALTAIPDHLSSLSPERFQTQADALLAVCRRQGADLTPPAAVDPALAPFVAAALQVRWTAAAAQAGSEAPPRGDGSCPICGARPVAGIVLGDHRVRYLACMLCGAWWYLPRVTCATCGSTADLSSFALAPADGGPEVAGVRAEACARCRSYVKHFDLELAPRAEPFADDLATLPLDLLMVEEGYTRAGANLFLLGPG